MTNNLYIYLFMFTYLFIIRGPMPTFFRGHLQMQFFFMLILFQKDFAWKLLYIGLVKKLDSKLKNGKIKSSGHLQINRPLGIEIERHYTKTMKVNLGGGNNK